MGNGATGSGAAEDFLEPVRSVRDPALWSEFMGSGGFEYGPGVPTEQEQFAAFIARQARASAAAEAQAEVERTATIAEDAEAFQVQVAEEKEAAEAAFQASRPPPTQIDFSADPIASDFAPQSFTNGVNFSPVPDNPQFAPQSLSGINFSPVQAVPGPSVIPADPFSGYTNFLNDAPSGTSFDQLFPFDPGISLVANGGPIRASEYLNAGGPVQYFSDGSDVDADVDADDYGGYDTIGPPDANAEATGTPGPPGTGSDVDGGLSREARTNLAFASTAGSPAMSVGRAQSAHDAAMGMLSNDISQGGLGRFSPAVGWGINSETGLATFADLAALNAQDQTGYAINNPQPTEAGLLASQVFGRLNPTTTNLAFGIGGLMPGVGLVSTAAGILEGRGFLPMARDAFQALAPETYDSLRSFGQEIGLNISQALPDAPDLSGFLGDPNSSFDLDPTPMEGPVGPYVAPIEEPIPDAIRSPVLPTDPYRLDLGVRDPNDPIDYSPFPVPINYRT